MTALNGKPRELETLPQAFEGLRADYDAARSTRFRRTRTGLVPSGSGADYHYKSEASYLRLMELARDMDRNDVIVGQTVDRAVTNAIQDGIRLAANTGDEGLDRELEDLWEEWGNTPEECDVAKEMCFSDMEYLALRHQFVDGDIVALPLKTGQLQMIEAHRIRKPRKTKRNVVNGVLLSDTRERLEFWITKDDVDPLRPVSLVSEVDRYAVRDSDGNRQLFHVFNPKRISQTRGVTALAPIFDMLGMFEDINFAKLVQQQVVSCFAIFRQMDVGGHSLNAPTQAGERTTEPLGDGKVRTIEGISPGMDIQGLPGETLTGFSPRVPNPEFFEHIKLVLTMIGVNLGLPLVLVTLDASETNFSGWRGAIDQARLGFRHNQKWLIKRFHRPVYLWKLRDWLFQDRALRRQAAKRKITIARHLWNPPSWSYIEPKKDAEADVVRLDNNLISLRRLYSERWGQDWGRVGKEIVEDRAKLIVWAIESADVINAKFTDAKVSWRELANSKMQPEVAVAAPAGDEDDDR